MAPPKLTLYLDIVSPFAYIAFYLTNNSPVFKKCDITYVPILLGGVMKACGNIPPLEIKNKDKWIERSRKQYKTRFSIPMSDSTPKPFPQSTVLTQRALCAIQLHHPEKLIPSVAALYHAFWAESKSPINSAEVIKPVLAGVLGEDGAKGVLEQAGSKEAKGLLVKNSDEAIAEGAFGLPYFVCVNEKGEKETFWGVDHLGEVCDFLGLERDGEKGFRALL